jgi:hypothetical protein
LILNCLRPKYYFFWSTKSLSQKIKLPLISFFSGVNYIWGEKFHKEWAVTEKIFQALPTQTDIIALIYKILYIESKHNRYPCLGRQGQQKPSTLNPNICYQMQIDSQPCTTIPCKNLTNVEQVPWLVPWPFQHMSLE